jgi:hypothetical protein
MSSNPQAASEAATHLLFEVTGNFLLLAARDLNWLVEMLKL